MTESQHSEPKTPAEWSAAIHDAFVNEVNFGHRQIEQMVKRIQIQAVERHNDSR